MRTWRGFALLQVFGLVLIGTSEAIVMRGPWSSAFQGLGCLHLILYLAGALCLLLSIALLFPTRRTAVIAPMIVLLTCELAASCSINRSVETGSRKAALLLSDPAQTVAEARRLMEGFTEPTGLSPAQLPASLRLRGLLYANLHRNHLDLVMSRLPDVEEGYRIWSVDAAGLHADQPTNYPDIYIYAFFKKNAESLRNIP